MGSTCFRNSCNERKKGGEKMSKGELTLKSIAGYCIEEALWKFLVDIVSEILGEKLVLEGIDPDMVIIENEDFHLEGTSNAIQTFCAPEKEASEPAMVWSLGALLSYASSGHLIFGGRGSLYQRKHPSVKLPVLQKKHSSLTPLVQRCLEYSPEKRIILNELVIEARNGLELCKKRGRCKSSNVAVKPERLTTNSIDERWPEKMIDITV